MENSDRYEKRHKNLAVHVSPAFRVELGDVVTVGKCATCQETFGVWLTYIHRAMSTTVKDGTIQRVAGVKEQSSGKGIREVLERLVYCQTMHACQ